MSTIDNNKTKLLHLIDNYKNTIDKYISYCTSFNLENEKKIFQTYINYIEIIKNELQSNSIPSYCEKSIADLLQIKYNLNLAPLLASRDEKYKNELISFSKHIKEIVNRLPITDTLKTLNYIKDNTILVGANGAGKSTLSIALSELLKDKEGIVIASQKLLIVPEFNSIPNFSSTEKQYQKYQKEYPNPKSTYKSSNPEDLPYSLTKSYGGEYHIILARLISERITKQAEFCSNAKAQGREEKQTKVNVNLEDLNCTLETAFTIWNSLIVHKTISCDSSHNIVLHEDEQEYPGHLMSDGEKVLLYYIGRVLLAPRNSLIVIDEPEMHLHRSITDKLWDSLENKRKDCTFLYVTHDIEFAATRQARKFWIKSFTPPYKWEIDPIESNPIPEELLLNILGSRKNILFCEGENNSLDKTILEVIFPNFTIIPVSTCKNVINYTKAFNKLPNAYKKAYGIIDRDFREEDEMNELSKYNIYAHTVAEIENILLIESFLSAFILYKKEDDKRLEMIKDKILEKFSKEIDQQSFSYVKAKLHFIFTEKYYINGCDIESLKQSCDNFCNSTQIDDWFEKRKEELTEICRKKNYSKVLESYNNKGLHSVVENILSYKQYKEKAIKFLKDKNENTRQYLINHFPKELVEAYNSTL